MLVVATGIVTDPSRTVDMRIVGMSVMVLEVPPVVILMRMAVVFPWPLDWSRS
jgi:hypothetical protein